MPVLHIRHPVVRAIGYVGTACGIAAVLCWASDHETAGNIALGGAVLCVVLAYLVAGRPGD